MIVHCVLAATRQSSAWPYGHLESLRRCCRRRRRRRRCCCCCVVVLFLSLITPNQICAPLGFSNQTYQLPLPQKTLSVVMSRRAANRLSTVLLNSFRVLIKATRRCTQTFAIATIVLLVGWSYFLEQTFLIILHDYKKLPSIDLTNFAAY